MNEVPRSGTAFDRYMAAAEPAEAAPLPQANPISLANIKATLWRQRIIIVVVTALALLAALVITMLSTPIYQAEATVRYDPPGGELIDGSDLERYVSANEIGSQMRTMAAVAQSRSMAASVVEDLELEDSEVLFGPDAGNGPPAGTAQEVWIRQRRAAAAGIVRGGVSVDVPFDSRVLTLRYRSRDPQLAADVVNALARNFLLDDISRGEEANAYARDFLEEQIADVRTRLADAEAQSIAFARANRIVGPGIGNSANGGEAAGTAVGTPATANAANLEQVRAAYARAREARILAQERWQNAGPIPAAQLPEVRQSVEVQTLSARITQLEGELTNLRERYRDDYPDVQRIIAELDVLQNRRAVLQASIKNAIRNAFALAQRQEAALAREVDRVADATLAEQDERVQFSLLDRDAEALRQQLTSLLERFNQLSSAANYGTSTLTMVDEATVPHAPISPNLGKNLLAGLLIGIGLSVGLALLRELLDDRLRSGSEVEQKLGLPLIGQTPYTGEEDVTSDLLEPFSPLAEAYSAIRATLDYAVLKGGRQIVNITSGEGAEGKTTTSVALAIRFAQVGRKVLLVDADLRKPSVAAAFGLSRPDTGVLDVLHGRTTLEKALLSTDYENLDVLGVSRSPDNPVEVLSSGLMAEFLAKQRERYDVIIPDSSPVLALADAPLVSRVADVTLLVVEANQARSARTRASIKRLTDGGAIIGGAILTKFRALEVGETYSYQYKYYLYGKDRAAGTG